MQVIGSGMRSKIVVCCAILCAPISLYAAPTEKKMVVMIPVYNAAAFIEQSLASVFRQKYDNYRVIITDDCSTDNTHQLIKNFVHRMGQRHRTTIIHNQKRRRALANVYHMVHLCQDDEIVVCLDGDDWLAHDLVLKRLNSAYRSSKVWLTYGQFQYPSGRLGFCAPIPPSVIRNRSFRSYSWRTSHLRTFYAGLFKNIKKEDLQLDGKFFPAAIDLAIMFPMLEMAGKKIAFIPEVLYIYNNRNPMNTFKVDGDLQLALERIIRKKSKYDRLRGRWPWSRKTAALVTRCFVGTS